MGDAEPYAIAIVARTPFSPSRPLGDWQMARAIARSGRRVIYVNPPVSVRRLAARGTRSLWSVDQSEVVDRVDVVTPLVPPGAHKRWGDTASDIVFGAQLSHAISTRFPRKKVVIIVFDPRRGSLRRVNRDLLVYWQRDLFSKNSRVRDIGHVAKRERELVANADLLTCVSPELVSRLASEGMSAKWIPNGCDFDLFSSRRLRRRPSAGGKRASIGFIGGVSWRVDSQLIAGVADARPEWDFHIVGELASTLPARDNVRVFGPRPYEDIPATIEEFDVGWIPYTPHPFNRCSFPLKVFEYLAVGRPVVSSVIPGLDGYFPYVRQAQGLEGTIAGIEAALRDGPGIAACRRLASQNTWSSRAEVLLALIELALYRQGISANSGSIYRGHTTIRGGKGAGRSSTPYRSEWTDY